MGRPLSGVNASRSRGTQPEQQLLGGKPFHCPRPCPADRPRWASIFCTQEPCSEEELAIMKRTSRMMVTHRDCCSKINLEPLSWAQLPVIRASWQTASLE